MNHAVAKHAINNRHLHLTDCCQQLQINSRKLIKQERSPRVSQLCLVATEDCLKPFIIIGL